jgi:hypothetical protein
MKKSIIYLLGTTLIASVAVSYGKTIVVNTVDNTDFSAGKTNLVRAIQLLADGDSINFAIPGAGVHVIDTPPDGYPLITRNGVTIDGYSQQQPGSLATANTASIHEANNAQLKIVLSSTNGNALSMYSAVTNFAGIDYPNLGFGDGEQAILGFFRASNSWVKGIAFLAAPQTSTSHEAGGDCKTICYAMDAPDVSSQGCQGFHVSGCWFGVDPTTRQVSFMPDGTTVATPAIAIATYGTGTNGTVAGFPNISLQPSFGTIGVAAGSANPRAEFNVFVTGYGFDSQGGPFRISGNFWGVLPDGVTLGDISVLNGGTQEGDAFVEFGGSHDILIGTDGDGVNDADEGNLFGSYAAGGLDIYYYGSQQRTAVAGNTFGVDIHGNSFNVGQFTKLVHHFNSDATCQIRFGSDFNGSNDAAEGNVVTDSILFDFDSGSSTNSHWLSMRGNSLTNTASAGLSRPPIGDGQNSSDGRDVYARFVDTSGGYTALIPVIGAGTTTTTLAGTCGLPLGSPYTNIIIDLYAADPNPTAPPQGQRWLGSFTDNSAGDSNPAVGAFSFDITSLGIAHGTKVTITATYTSDPHPIIGSFAHTTGTTTVNIKNGPTTYAIQKSATVDGTYAFAATAVGSASFGDNNGNSFYRVSGGGTANGMTCPFSDVFTIP